jgi:dipeptidyl aminopeptidase/acylaminoacyl peptidase
VPATRPGRLTVGFIAVDAVPAGNDAEGLERLDLPRNLYLLDDDGEIKTTLLRNLPSAGASSWSPDSRRLALPIDPEDGPRGLYLVDTATGDVSLVLEGDELGASVWLPDGRTLVVATGIFSQLDESDNDVGLYKSCAGGRPTEAAFTAPGQRAARARSRSSSATRISRQPPKLVPPKIPEPAVATGGNRWQMGGDPERLESL